MIPTTDELSKHSEYDEFLRWYDDDLCNRIAELEPDELAFIAWLKGREYERRFRAIVCSSDGPGNEWPDDTGG